jgi:hypothetical protein
VSSDVPAATAAAPARAPAPAVTAPGADAAEAERGGRVVLRLAGAFARAVLFHVLLGVVAPLIVLMFVGLLGRAAVRPQTLERRPTLREVALLVLGVPCIVAALVVPLRAAVQVALFAAERSGESVHPWWRAVLVSPGLDTFLGWCAVVLSLIALVRLQSTRAKLRQVRNLPTSRARSAAAGLVELQGIARAVPEPLRARELTERGPHVDWDTVLPAGTILGKDSHSVAGQDARHTTCEVSGRFMLEDGAGRILVDPRGASFGSFNTLYQFGAPPARIALSKARLVDGDPVYVLGTVEPRADAPALAVDAERLVVSALPAAELAARPRDARATLPSNPFAQPAGRVFLLADSSEPAIRRELERSLVDTFAFEMLLFVAALWLVVTHAPALWR